MDSKRPEHELALLDFIRTFSRENGYPPSTREMAAALDFKSVESVHRLLIHLKAMGRVTWIPNKARTLRILNQD